MGIYMASPWCVYVHGAAGPIIEESVFRRLYSDEVCDLANHKK